MKDSDLGIPPRPPVLNGPTAQTPPVEEKRGPGRPAGTSTPREPANVKTLSTELIIETKRHTEILVAASAGLDPRIVELVADVQLAVSDLERELITRRKGNKPA